MTDAVTGNIELAADCIRADSFDDLGNRLLAHGKGFAKLISNRQANSSFARQNTWHAKTAAMNETVKPYADIAERLKWHRDEIEHLTQQEYAEALGVKRSALSLWEAGSHRLSLDGALLLRSKFGLSLDFMYEGIDDALPMTLRQAWRERP